MSQEIQEVFPPPQVYPQENSSPGSGHRSNGSFGSVFIVLAIIIVVSAAACFLGRLCNKRSQKGEKRSKSSNHKEGKMKHQQKQQAFPKKEWEPKHNQTRDNGDIEFGFDSKRHSTSKVAANNGHDDGHDTHHHGAAMGNSRSFKGDHQMRFPGGDAAGMMMGPGGPMRFSGGGGGDGGPAMGPSRSFRNGEFRGDQMRFSEFPVPGVRLNGPH